MTAQTIVETLKGWIPNKFPVDELTPFEYGVLAGQQMQIDKLEALLTQLEPTKQTEKDK